jgi:hypothetical protein
MPISQGAARPRPQADQTAERPQIDEQNERILFAADRGKQEVAHDVQLTTHDAGHRDSREQR